MSRQFKKYLFESPSVENGEEAELQREDFEFERKLGDGAFGQVWRVRHKLTNKLYALKQVPKEKVIRMIPQFCREVYIMYELDHPHIIKLYNHFEDEKYFCLIMELAEGGTLFSKLYRERSFVERVAAQYFREIVLAVEYLHSHVPAIIHRDIKPENILIDKDGRLKLTDFGWSNYYTDDTQTPRHTMCGTLEYLPPEMIEEKMHDTSADIWCLGVLLFELLTGDTPFKGVGKQDMLTKITVAKTKFPASMSPLAKDLISRMLEKESVKRISAHEIKEHRWLLDHPPIRETISQDPELKVLRIDEKPKVEKGYLIISTYQAKRFANKQMKIQIQTPPKPQNRSGSQLEAFKKSIDKLKLQNEKKMRDMNNTRSLIEEKEKHHQKLSHNLHDIEVRIEEKRAEYKKLVDNENNIVGKINDLDLELDRISNTIDMTSLTEKARIELEEYNAKDQLCKLHKAQLDKLRQEVKQKTLDMAEKERNLKIWQEKNSKKKEKISTHIRNESIEILKLEKETTSLKNSIVKDQEKSMSKNDQAVSQEMVEFIKKRLNELTGISNLQDKITLCEKKISEKEKKIIESKIEFVERRAELFREMNEKRTKRKENQKILMKENFSPLKALKLKLDETESRGKGYEINQNLIQNSKKKISELKSKIDSLNHKINNVRKKRYRLNLAKKERQLEIESIEMEIGLTKAKIFECKDYLAY